MMEGRCLTDRFWILETIGAGGVTEVSLAHDAEMGERVALRLLAEPLAEHWEVLRDACREARQLAHPHIARVFDFHRGEGTAFVCREYVEGVHLGESTGRSIEERLVAFAQVAAALEAAHALGVVHGDLKTSKILRDARGNVRVIDFRFAVALRTATSAAVSGDHFSPQVRSGASPVAADDIYSLGFLFAQTLSPAHAPRELRELIEAMSAEQRAARPTDLREIRQALTAHSKTGKGAPDATLFAAPLARPSAVAPMRADESLRPQYSAGSSRNLQYAIASGALAVAALIVFFALPRWVESPSAPLLSTESVETDDREGALPETRDPAASKTSAESLLARLPPLRAQLEGWAIDRWAATDFAEAREIEGRGDAAFINGDYGTAHARYGEALATYESLAERRAAVLAESLENGAAALEAGDSPRAVVAFDLALAIEPNNAVALDGARSAENLAVLLTHLSAGERFETGEDLDAAQREYAQAVAIDPQFAPAREALERVEATRANDDYEANLALALAALANGSLGTARTHFGKARALRPGSPEVVDGLRQLQQIVSSRAIATQRKLAESAEGAENWSEAASHYQSIIDTQENLQFAEDGLQRSRELASVTERASELLEDPTQLFRPEALEEARRLMELGKGVAERAPKLTEQLRRLEIAAQLASTPIPVVFQSDTITEVVIRGVGTLGRFASRDVPLKPGHYVVLGRRDGYRDTRREISVIPGRQQPVVEVRCTDKI
jgi:serine/threonine protein kinase